MKHLLSTLRSISLVAAVIVAMIGMPLLAPQMAGAQANEQALCEGSGGTWSGSACTTTGGRTVAGTLKQVNTILLFIVGAIAVLMVIIGGLRYVTSSGDQASITSAKNTIIYAIVGLIVAFAAYGIVNFILDNIGA